MSADDAPSDRGMLNLEDTRTIAVRADTVAAEALRASTRIEDRLDTMRRENSQQHGEARQMVSRGLRRVHDRLDALHGVMDEKDERLLAAVRHEMKQALSHTDEKATAAAQTGAAASTNTHNLERWVSRGVIAMLLGLVSFLVGLVLWLIKNPVPHL
jgi:predicted phage gp36 major capsid-like protein